MDVTLDAVITEYHLNNLHPDWEIGRLCDYLETMHYRQERYQYRSYKGKGFWECSKKRAEASMYGEVWEMGLSLCWNNGVSVWRAWNKDVTVRWSRSSTTNIFQPLLTWWSLFSYLCYLSSFKLTAIHVKLSVKFDKPLVL